jgi:hypothetical protein
MFEGDGQQYRPIPGYKWVDDRTLGFLDKQNPLWSAFEHPIPRMLIKGADAINSIQKDMILYLKPAYAFPNAFGNLFLNIVQQGLFAPVNLAKSFKLFNGLKPETIEKIRTLMGGGAAEQLKSPGFAGGVHRVSNAFASGYGKFVDDPFRFASFLHEARLDGFSSQSELEQLLTDPAHADQVEAIANRANEAILNYDRMGPGEQAILRRLVFFYPWLKASTRYAGYFAREHPVMAGMTSPLGQMGEERQKSILGDLPSFMEGAIPFTGRQGSYWNPTAKVGLASSAAILQEPADLAKIVTNLVSSHPNLDLTAFSNLTPVDAAMLALGTAGKISSTRHDVNQSPFVTALHEAFGGNPLFGNSSSLLEQLTGGPASPNAIYNSNSMRDALLKFLVWGTLGPRQVNIPAANYSAWLQQNPTQRTIGG